MTIQEFVKKHKIKMKSERRDTNPNMTADQWSKTATHWYCLFTRGKKQMGVFFSQGSAHKKPPTTEEVLDCLGSDYSIWSQTGSYDDFCAEMGFDCSDPTSDEAQRGLRAWQAISQYSRKLQQFLGTEDAQYLMDNVERL